MPAFVQQRPTLNQTRFGSVLQILAKAGVFVAKLIPYHGAPKLRTPGSMAGEITIAPDFDSLPDDIADAFGMREPRT
jgi:antitoxin (DNA-binding transcriptional repressor) of toxin-antitoxin stability system